MMRGIMMMLALAVAGSAMSGCAVRYQAHEDRGYHRNYDHDENYGRERSREVHERNMEKREQKWEHREQRRDEQQYRKEKRQDEKQYRKEKRQDMKWGESRQRNTKEKRGDDDDRKRMEYRDHDRD